MLARTDSTICRTIDPGMLTGGNGSVSLYSLKDMRNNTNSFVHAGACKYIRTGNPD